MPTRIESLIADLIPLSPAQDVGEVFEWFMVHADRRAMPVVFERTAIGILTREAVFECTSRLSTPSASRKTIMAMVDTDFARARLGQPLGEVAHEVALQNGKAFEQGLIVMHAGAFYGYVSARSLSMALSDENTRRAQQMQVASGKLRSMGKELAQHRRDAGLSIARLGHEIRTPLTAMLGHTERLLRKDLQPDARQSLDVIARATELLADLVARAVEAGQIASGESTTVPKPFSPADLVSELAQLWSVEAEDKGLSFDAVVSKDLPSRLEGDVDRIRQVLGNLISNAIKYTPSGGVHLVLDGAFREEGHVAFRARVSDTGPGIAEAELDRLFAPFQRLKAAGQSEGAGLGLSISRGLARAMGGDLTFERGQNGGSIFTLALPVRRAGPRLAIEGKTRPARPGRAAFQLGDILLIEDHAASQALIENTLGGAGWRVDTVATLAQARRRIDHKPYQAILCDYFLRDGQGDVLMKMLRGHKGPNMDTLCLAVTADSSEARRRHCLAAGFAGVIVKPIRGPELITTLADFITAADRSSEVPGAIMA